MRTSEIKELLEQGCGDTRYFNLLDNAIQTLMFKPDYHDKALRKLGELDSKRPTENSFDLLTSFHIKFIGTLEHPNLNPQTNMDKIKKVYSLIHYLLPAGEEAADDARLAIETVFKKLGIVKLHVISQRNVPKILSSIEPGRGKG